MKKERRKVKGRKKGKKRIVERTGCEGRREGKETEGIGRRGRGERGVRRKRGRRSKEEEGRKGKRKRGKREGEEGISSRGIK